MAFSRWNLLLLFYLKLIHYFPCKPVSCLFSSITVSLTISPKVPSFLLVACATHGVMSWHHTTTKALHDLSYNYHYDKESPVPGANGIISALLVHGCWLKILSSNPYFKSLSLSRFKIFPKNKSLDKIFHWGISLVEDVKLFLAAKLFYKLKS